MPRKFRLTWQPGTGKRPDRWRKKYRGKVHYFDGGCGKHDRKAYEAALTDWEALKVELDATAPKRHQADYEREVARWEAVLNWCRQHDDSAMLETAVTKLSKLRDCLAAPKLRPLRQEDTFDGQFQRHVRDPDGHRWAVEVGAAVEAASTNWTPDADIDLGRAFVEARKKLDAVDFTVYEGAKESICRETTAIDPAEFDLTAPDPLRLEGSIWQDRLDVMQRDAVSTDESTEAYASLFLKQKRSDVDARQLTSGRYDTIQRYVNEFVAWHGGSQPVDKINGLTLTNYRAELLQQFRDKGWSGATTNDRLDTVKSFIRWLWQIEAIPTLPRNIAARLDTSKLNNSPPAMVVFEKPEISRLLEKASQRTQLYLLLMLNCGMTQKDIADLTHGEVDWEEGRIIRKRSKTRQFKNVPEVSYLLWPKTFRLLQEMATDTSQDVVLVNSTGGRLWQEETLPSGKHRKGDNIRTAFGRLQRKTGIKKPLKSLKKTSATLIRGNSKYASLASLFLGHAPKSMSERHYTLPPQQLLDEAIQWLAGEHGLADGAGRLS